MQSLDQYPQYSESSFNASFMRDLYCKLNKQCFAIVDKKLKDLCLEVKECSWKDFKNWIEEANLEEKNLFNFSNKKQPPRHSGNFQQNILEKNNMLTKTKRAQRNNQHQLNRTKTILQRHLQNNLFVIIVEFTDIG